MPREGDAANMSPQRCVAMPSPAWSRRSRRRDLVALDQDKRSVEVTLGQTVHKKSVVPLGLCSTRSLLTVPLSLCSARNDFEVFLGRHKKSSECMCRSLPPTPICAHASMVVLPPADEAGKAKTQEERRPTSSSARDRPPSNNFVVESR